MENKKINTEKSKVIIDLRLRYLELINLQNDIKAKMDIEKEHEESWRVSRAQDKIDELLEVLNLLEDK